MASENQKFSHNVWKRSKKLQCKFPLLFFRLEKLHPEPEKCVLPKFNKFLTKFSWKIRDICKTLKNCKILIKLIKKSKKSKIVLFFIFCENFWLLQGPGPATWLLPYKRSPMDLDPPKKSCWGATALRIQVCNLKIH